MFITFEEFNIIKYNILKLLMAINSFISIMITCKLFHKQ